jgi:hypothetical protein
VIAVKDLKFMDMTWSAKGTLAAPGSNVWQEAGLNGSLADAAPGRLIEMIRYEAEKGWWRDDHLFWVSSLVRLQLVWGSIWKIWDRIWIAGGNRSFSDLALSFSHGSVH